MNNRNKVIDKWRTKESADFNYFDVAEENLGQFWTEKNIYRNMFDKLELSSVVELACGKGRHAAQIVNKCERLILADTSIDAINYCKIRFGSYNNVSCFLIEGGDELSFVPDQSISAIFSYDAMVHFEPISVYSYLMETNRILKPGGRALFHHSNYSKLPDSDFNLAPGWRNYMTSDLFRHFVHRSGLMLLEHTVIEWSEPDSDALSLLQKPITN